MKKFLIDQFNRFKNKSLIRKLLSVFLIILYIASLLICIIKIDVASTSPGTITSVNNVIHINSDNDQGQIYTVSVYGKSRVSLLEYFLIKNDKFSDIKKGKETSLQVLTNEEEYLSNYGYKIQSIQDSLILAYSYAKNNGNDVNLIYSYLGEYLIHIPQNSLNTGGDDFKNGDVITSFNNVNISSNNELNTIFNNIISSFYSVNPCIKEFMDLYNNDNFSFYDSNNQRNEYNINLLFKTLKAVDNIIINDEFTVVRPTKTNPITIKPSLSMVFYIYTGYLKKVYNGNDMLYQFIDRRFSKYDIDYANSTPSIDISKSDSVGPSGGLLQTLSIYNAITNNDITKQKLIMGTGGINIEIDESGNVISNKISPIGGEKQKIVVAHLYNADIFFVPEENYDSAKKMYDSLIEPKFEIVKVNNFNDVIEYLNSLQEEDLNGK